MSLFEHFEHNKIKASFGAIGAYITGLGVGQVEDYHIPPVFLESLQAMAYTVSIAVGSITLFAWAQKRVKNWLKNLWK